MGGNDDMGEGGVRDGKRVFFGLKNKVDTAHKLWMNIGFFRHTRDTHTRSSPTTKSGYDACR